MVALTFVGYLNGNPYNIFRGTAPTAICGQSYNGVDATAYPYMYLYNPIPYSGTVDVTKRICVEKCPVIVNSVV